MIDRPAQQRLLDVARQALAARVRGEQGPAVLEDLNWPVPGLFVTIYCDGHLRGCLGTMAARVGLAEAVIRLAADVSSEDPRFRRLAVHELPHVTIQVSVLTPAQRVTDPSEIEVGRDGLIVEQGGRRGLLLPQVATDHGWDRETLLAQSCLKAGLPPDAWKRSATVLRFQADLFGEERAAEER